MRKLREMVMETPTPQCVGREFVRQYYTLLNRAPMHLHRFYSHDSIFLHGGLDRPGQETRPVVGQQDIHQQIIQLGFTDCHAKIIQVDSLETVGNGVVVLVTGELSNNGGPMRRFTQTFVLVLQSPKKYYVRNDIFRYQDEIFSEDDNDIDGDDNATLKSSATLTQDDDNVGYHENEIVRNGTMYTSEVSKFTTPLPQRENTVSPQPELEVESTKSDWDEEEEEEEDEELEEEEIQQDRTTEDMAPEVIENPPAVSQEPKTYANMVSKNTSSSAPQSLPVTSNTTSPVSNLPPPHKSEQPVSYKAEGTPTTGNQINRDKNEGGSTFGQGNRASRPRLNSGRTRFESGHDTSARSPEDSDADKRKPAFIHYPDSQQLFVGNLTHSITEEDLKTHFTQFGKVLDMRINTKQTQKIGGGKVPNFGFIVFDDAESVQKVLNARPIYFNEHRLNVEEKKRPKDNRIISGDSRVGPPRGGPSPRVGVGGRGPRGGMMPQGTGRGDSRGGMRGSYTPRR